MYSTFTMKCYKTNVAVSTELRDFLVAFVKKHLPKWDSYFTAYADYTVFYLNCKERKWGTAGKTSHIDDVYTELSVPQMIDEILKLAKIQPVILPLNETYNAEVSLDGNTVKVGCQTFNSEVILTVADAIKKQRQLNV